MVSEPIRKGLASEPPRGGIEADSLPARRATISATRRQFAEVRPA